MYKDFIYLKIIYTQLITNIIQTKESNKLCNLFKGL